MTHTLQYLNVYIFHRTTPTVATKLRNNQASIQSTYFKRQCSSNCHSLKQISVYRPKRRKVIEGEAIFSRKGEVPGHQVYNQHDLISRDSSVDLLQSQTRKIHVFLAHHFTLRFE